MPNGGGIRWFANPDPDDPGKSAITRWGSPKEKNPLDSLLFVSFLNYPIYLDHLDQNQ
jgi:hypothetical protein